ncbi:MAG: ATP-binding protein [Planctomycetota bacterium]
MGTVNEFLKKALYRKSGVERIGMRGGFPIREEMVEYAARILRRCEHTELVLKFAVAHLDRAGALRLADFASRELDPKADKPGKLTREKLRRMSPWELGDALWEQCKGGTLAVSIREISGFAADLLEAKAHRTARQRNVALRTGLAEFRKMFRLSEDEIRLVVFFYAVSQSPKLENCCTTITLNRFFEYPAVALDRPRAVIQKLLSADGRLARSGIIRRTPSEHPPICLAEGIVDYLAGGGGLRLAERYFREGRGRCFPVSSFGLPARTIGVVKALLAAPGPGHILFHGVAGSGKTEFARTIAAAAGRRAYYVTFGKDGGIRDRQAAIEVAANAVPVGEGVVVVDEADGILNNQFAFFGVEAVGKGWLNDFLDRGPAKMIWISNETNWMDESIRRRFAMSVRFERFGRRERERVWGEIARKSPFRRHLQEDILRDLAGRFKVGVGGVAAAVKALLDVVGGQATSGERVREALEELLGQHERLTRGNEVKLLAPLVNRYDPEILHLDGDLPDIIRAVTAAGKRTPGDWDTVGGGLNLLLWGVSGTGKTEFAKYLAREAGMDIVIRRASDLLNKYVGGTEKNIREAFDEARRDRAILLVDEADTFFIDRRFARMSWESSQTNEFLAQMEGHGGVLVCATNLIDRLDPASLRRFHWKVAFRPPTREGRLALYRKYFSGPGKSADPEAEERIAAMENITPGDFEAVRRKFSFLAGKPPDPDVILDALESELKYREDGCRHRMGFGG